ncbi:pentapeptide repeat-containing protein [Anaerotignum sp.]|uniref:pentapeptide repeat-containing protein n=1 Tax=Anaerotignum sp. TaxID=2039241 RepID=UPI00289EB95D|nr:pentapeptide repeat-containing protein [Anaerotignum sp.]
MNIAKPKISKEILQIDEFYSYVKDRLSDDISIFAIKSYAERIEGMDFSRMELKSSILENCKFCSCNFKSASFIDVIFQSCDLSNSKFADAYFERCQFVDCKCVGLDMHRTVIKQTTFEQSNFKYSNFDETKMNAVFFDNIDFTESSISEAKLKKFEAKNSKFIKNNFFKTMLATVDFTDNEFKMPLVSTPPIELKGMVINMFQAAELISLMGIIVNQ